MTLNDAPGKEIVLVVDDFPENLALLYDALDASHLFKAPVAKADRSRMNVVFDSGDADTDAAFVKFCDERGLKSLKGHRVRGGMRASLYNAMPVAGVEALVAAVREFEALRA